MSSAVGSARLVTALRRPLYRGALLVLLCFGVIACGQKGPLYLPQPQPAPENNESAAP